ncbi:MAG: hypothetical protein ABI791_11630 [Acidobacteriota bacterium]
MRRRNSASFASPTYIARDTSSVSWGYFILTVVCACVVAAGFFLAARQHFNTIDYGFKNGRLRKQVDDLQTERRRLLLAREVSMSPAEIKRAAKNLGFRDRGEVVMIAAKTPTLANSTAVRNADTVSTPSRVSDAPTPVKAFYPEAAKVDAVDRSVKKIVMQKVRKVDDSRLVASVR